MSQNLIQDIKNIRENQNLSTMAFLNLLTELNEEKAKEQLNKIQILDSQVIKLSDLLHMPTEKPNLQLLDDIEVIRTDNNKNWMDVVRLCFELDEERAQAIFYKIKECDKQIRDKSKQIAENEKR